MPFGRVERMGGVLKGHGGAVRSIALHPEEDLVASVGLDRWLRVHDGATRKQLVKVYLKQQLTSVAWCPCDPPTPETHAAPEAVRMKRSSSKEGSSKGKKKRLVALP